MPTAAYQIIRSTTVIVRQGTHERLQTLDAGAILIPISTEDDPAGMIEATCDGNVVRVFARDLEERGHPIDFGVVES